MQNVTPSPDALLDARQVARLLGCSTRTISTLTASGALPSVKLGRLRKYRPAAIEAYVRSLEQVGDSAA